jgi:hypothetical protein
MVVKPRTVSNARALEKYPESTLKITSGLHRKPSGNLTVFDVEMNGRNFQYRWAENVPMLPFMTDVLLDDMQIGTEEFFQEELAIRASLKEYCLETISYNISFSEDALTIGKMRELLWSFYKGFRAGTEGNDPSLSEF